METKSIPITEGTLYDLILDVPPAILKHYELVQIDHDDYVTTRAIPFLPNIGIRSMLGGGVQLKYRALTFGSIHYALRFIGDDTEYKEFIDKYNSTPESNMITNELENNLVDDVLTAAKEYDDSRKDKTFPEEEDRPPYGWTPAPLPKYIHNAEIWLMQHNKPVQGWVHRARVLSEYNYNESHHNMDYDIKLAGSNIISNIKESSIFPSKQLLLDSL